MLKKRRAVYSKAAHARSEKTDAAAPARRYRKGIKRASVWFCV